jgi:hypothetical protein
VTPLPFPCEYTALVTVAPCASCARLSGRVERLTPKMVGGKAGVRGEGVHRQVHGSSFCGLARLRWVKQSDFKKIKIRRFAQTAERETPEGACAWQDRRAVLACPPSLTCASRPHTLLPANFLACFLLFLLFSAILGQVPHPNTVEAGKGERRWLLSPPPSVGVVLSLASLRPRGVHSFFGLVCLITALVRF